MEFKRYSDRALAITVIDNKETALMQAFDGMAIGSGNMSELMADSLLKLEELDTEEVLQCCGHILWHISLMGRCVGITIITPPPTESVLPVALAVLYMNACIKDSLVLLTESDLDGMRVDREAMLGHVHRTLVYMADILADVGCTVKDAMLVNLEGLEHAVKMVLTPAMVRHVPI